MSIFCQLTLTDVALRSAQIPQRLCVQIHRSQISAYSVKLSFNIRNWQNMVVGQPVVEPKEKTPDEMRVSSEEESTDLHVSAEMSKRPNTSKQTGRHKVFTPLPEDLNCQVRKLTKTTRAPCRNCLEARGGRTHLLQTFGDATTADHKVLKKKRISLVGIVTQSWCRIFLLGFNATHKESNCAGKNDTCAKVLAARSETRQYSSRSFCGIHSCL